MKKFKVYLQFLFFFCSLFLHGQDDPSYVIRYNQESSYVTLDKFPSTFKEDILTEMALKQSMYFHYNSFLPKWWLEFNPGLCVRLTDTNYTAMNPQFQVDFKLYRSIYYDQNRSGFIVLGGGHHSNGQNDLFLIENTKEINYETGDFATDYLRIGFLMHTQKEDFSFLQFYRFEYHPGFFKNSRRNELYKIYNEMRIEGKWMWMINKPEKMNHWMFTLKSKLLLENLNQAKWDNYLTIDLKTSWQPRFLREPGLWVFVQAYTGEDYYHIHFVDSISFFRIGLEIRPN